MQRPVVDLLTEKNVDPQSWFRRYELYIELFVHKPDGKREEDSPGILATEADEARLEATKARYLAFYLGGKVLATYEQLPMVVQGDFEQSKAKLLAAYRMSSATAYAKFVSMMYTEGSVDMFVAELRRMLGLVPGMQHLSSKDKDGLILEQLFRGLSGSLARELRLVCMDTETGEVHLDKVLERARLLPELQTADESDIVVRAPKLVGAVPLRGGPTEARGRARPMRCFKCGKEGHLRKDCKVKDIVCFGCGKPGHIKTSCPNGSGAAMGQSPLQSASCPSSPSA